MPSSYTTSLRLILPATGELAGQWGAQVNQGITELLDAAVAGTASISTWGGAGVAYTLSNNSGTSDEARRMFILATGAPGEAKNVICPAVSKFYVFRNDTTGGFALTLKTPSGTGIAVPAGQYKFLYCNGTDVVEAFNSAGALTLSGALSVGGTATFAANPTLSAGTANGVLYLNGSKVATSGSGLVYDGTILRVNGSTSSGLRLASNSGASNGFNIYNDSTTDIAYLTNFYNGATVFGINNAEQMRLTSTGLGIGTSSPGAKLEVNVPGTTGTSSALRLSRGIGYGTTDFKQYYTSGTDYGLTIGNTVSDYLTLNLASGNLGLGVTPSAWGSDTKAIQLGGSTFSAFAADLRFLGLANARWDGTNFRYLNTVPALQYRMSAGTGAHEWYTAPSGTAGNAISFTQAMTLSSTSGPALRVGVTADLGAFNFQAANQVGFSVHNSGSSATAAYFSAASNVALTGAGSSAVVNGVDGILLGVNGTERARITSGGVLLVGTTSAPSIGGVSTDHALVASTNGRWTTGFKHTTSATPWGIAIEYSAAAPNDTSSNFLYCYDSAPAVRMSVRSNGGIANYQGNDVNLSDRREKTNFAPAKSYLDTICAIPVQTFNYIDQSEDDPGLTLGVVAQDVQAVAPELVMESNWGTADEPKQRLSIYQTDLQYALMKALQELKAQNDELRARVAALESN